MEMYELKTSNKKLSGVRKVKTTVAASSFQEALIEELKLQIIQDQDVK
jgi:hypothetical protein